MSVNTYARDQERTLQGHIRQNEPKVLRILKMRPKEENNPAIPVSSGRLPLRFRGKRPGNDVPDKGKNGRNTTLK
jgi:hypothetical protein